MESLTNQEGKTDLHINIRRVLLISYYAQTIYFYQQEDVIKLI